jgi:chemotaxis protein methyltransferase CheR
VREADPSGRVDFRLLATDIDTNVLQTAQAGVYGERDQSGLDEQRLRRWFLRGRGSQQGRICVKDELREPIDFRPLNLIGDWPMKGPFDVIFCRNVVIYFDKATQRRLFTRMADLLADGGHLFIGHSETLFKVCDRFKLLGQTIYRKVA